MNGARRLAEELSLVIRDRRVLDAVMSVPRDLFVPPDLTGEAWRNEPLPIGEGQTISQPLIVARMCELLELSGDETVLDVGTGSGWHAAILSRLAGRVVSIERYPELSERAAGSLDRAGIENVELVVGDGTLGVPGSAPFDAINVAAASETPPPPALLEQLAEGGRMVIPVDGGVQKLLLVRKRDGKVETEEHERVRFVPLVEGEP
jgi:protein-L-isoaspartate(D-aspartate) O-methyltransferase